MHASRKSYHIITFWKQKCLWLIGLFTITKILMIQYVATEQLTAVVDVTFTPQDNPNNLDSHEIH